MGSEGTLGIVTRAVVRLHSKPIDSVVSLIAIQTFDAVRQVAKSLDQLAGGPCALEVMWGEYYSSVVATAQIANAPLATDYEYYLLVEWFDRGCITGIEQSLGALMEEGKIIDATIAQSERQASEIWAIRDGVEFVSEDLGGAGVGYDISLPVSSMEGYVNGVTQRLKEADSRSRCIAFGHLGDGNLHLITSAQDQVDVDRAVYEPLREFNGSISAEHGIGSKKKPFLKISRTELEIEMMRSLKHWIDPKMILNPGKIF
ncbi:MAG: hypothetical protein CME41_04240 [Haliea sp.]|nr:hypothetical protein [Haliea sp.]MBP69142.1 hypothetical protein [Haliea sp.]